MKPPYYKLTNRCTYEQCPVDEFVTERKQVQKVSEAGTLYTTTRQVCPKCRTWGTVIRIEEVVR